MVTKRLFALFMLSFGLVAHARAKDEALLAAIEKLKQAGSYTWRTEVVLTPGVPAIMEGRFSSVQGLHLKITAGKNTVELAARSGVVVAKTDDEWKPVKKFTRSDIDHTMVRELRDFKLPHLDLARVQGAWRAGRKNTAEHFEGQVSLGEARKLLSTSIRQAGALQVASLSPDFCNAVVHIVGGLPDRLIIQSKLSGSQGILATQSLQLLVSTRFSNIGSTQVQLPPEAEAAILAAKLP